jgi:hypothetical protein
MRLPIVCPEADQRTCRPADKPAPGQTLLVVLSKALAEYTQARLGTTPTGTLTIEMPAIHQSHKVFGQTHRIEVARFYLFIYFCFFLTQTPQVSTHTTSFFQAASGAAAVAHCTTPIESSALRTWAAALVAHFEPSRVFVVGEQPLVQLVAADTRPCEPVLRALSTSGAQNIVPAVITLAPPNVVGGPAAACVCL